MEETERTGYETDRYDECFGCGQAHPYGMRMSFRVIGEHEVESTFRGHPTHAGAPGIIHGGLQATLLDEVSGFACHTLDPPGVDSNLVTMTFQLRYRRPVPTGVDLRVVGRVTDVDGDDMTVESVIELPDGTAATIGTARWRRLP